MELTCPTNWDDALLEHLAGLPVREIYGAIPGGPVGGGRPGFLLGSRSSRHALAHVGRVRDRGWDFSLTLNAPCMGPMGEGERRRILDHVDRARGSGANGVTVSIPLLAEILRARFPDLRIKVSVIAHVGTASAVRAWEALGVDEINVDFNANRDFPRLQRLRGAARRDLSLLVNDLCLLHCPWRISHYNYVGHASQGSRRATVDDCFFRCHHHKVTHPRSLLQSPWIRPEDLHLYEALGFVRFKLAGRTRSTQDIVRAARAYASRRWDGNLLRLLEAPRREAPDLAVRMARRVAGGAPGVLSLLGPLRRGLRGRVPFLGLLADLPANQAPLVLQAYLELMDLADGIHLDNRALDGFLEALLAAGCLGDCGACGQALCDAWADRALRVDPDRARALARALERVRTDLAG